MLATLLNDFRRLPRGGTWALAHMDHHRAMVVGIQKKYQAEVILYPLDQMPLDNMSNWLRTHQLMHDAVAKYTGTDDPNVSDIDLHNDAAVRIWLQQHLDEHIAVAQALGIEG